MPRYRILDGNFGNGKHVGDVIDLAADAAALHASQLQLVPEASSPKPPPALVGSDLLPALFHMPSGKDVQLGQIVAAAHEASGLSVEAWNNLDGAAREALLDSQLIHMIEADKASAAKG